MEEDHCGIAHSSQTLWYCSAVDILIHDNCHPGDPLYSEEKRWRHQHGLGALLYSNRLGTAWADQRCCQGDGLQSSTADHQSELRRLTHEARLVEFQNMDLDDFHRDHVSWEAVVGVAGGAPTATTSAVIHVGQCAETLAEVMAMVPDYMQ